jgi:hypothetical protein
MARGANQIVAEEEVKSSGRQRESHVVDHTSTEVVRPKYRYIEQQVMDAGVGKLGPALSYVNTVHRALGEFSSEVDERVREKSRKSSENIGVYERQEQMSSHLAASESLSSFQIGLNNLQAQYLQENPSGEGLYDLTLNAINEEGKNIISSMGTPQLRAEMQKHLNGVAVDSLSRALGRETQQREAFLQTQFQEQVNLIAQALSVGVGDPGDQIRSLDVLVDGLPEKYKDKYAAEARRNLVFQSLTMQCQSNPDLAEANLKKQDSLYASLTPWDRIHLQQSIHSRRKDLEREARQYRNNVIRSAATHPEASEQALFDGVNSGKVNFFDADLLLGQKKISPQTSAALKREIAKRNMTEAKAMAYDNACHELARRDGNYGSIKKEDQVRFASEALISEKVYDDSGAQVFGEKPMLDDQGNPVLDEAGNVRVERRPMALGDAPLPYICNYMKKFTVPLPVLQDRIISDVMGSPDPGQVTDAINAYRSLKYSNSALLGDQKSKFNREMTSAISILDRGGGPLLVRSHIVNMRSNLESAAERELKYRLRANKEDVFDASRIKGGNFDSSDPYEVQTAKIMYEDEFISSKGNSELAYQNVSTNFESLKKSSGINGDKVSSFGIGYPENFIGRDARRQFATYASESIADLLDTTEGREANGISSYAFPNKLSQDFNDVQINGKDAYYFFVPANDKGEYFVKYNYKGLWAQKGFGAPKASYKSGYFINDPKAGGPLKIKMNDALEYKYQEKIGKLSLIMENALNPTPDKAQDLQMAFGSNSPEEIDNVINFYA